MKKSASKDLASITSTCTVPIFIKLRGLHKNLTRFNDAVLLRKCNWSDFSFKKQLLILMIPYETSYTILYYTPILSEQPLLSPSLQNGPNLFQDRIQLFPYLSEYISSSPFSRIYFDLPNPSKKAFLLTDSTLHFLLDSSLPFLSHIRCFSSADLSFSCP